MSMFQVMTRPVSPSGVVYRGTKPGDYVAILSHPENVLNSAGTLSAPVELGVRVNGQSSSVFTSFAKYVPAGSPVPSLMTGSGTSSATAKSHVVEVQGEPWIVHSTHTSFDAAMPSASRAAAALGAENVRIVKVMTGTNVFKLN